MRIADRLNTARRSTMVGRTREMAQFRSAIASDTLPFCVLAVCGPGGVGKTTLLHAFADTCAELGVATIGLDGRNIESTPEGFLQALRQALEIEASASPIAALSAAARRHVLLVDTYETLEELDGWLRDSFLPRLPDDTFVVLSGRNPLSSGWHADAGWQAMVQTSALRNLSPDESRSLLRAREVPEDQHAAVLHFTHGYPLALSLITDLFRQRGSLRFEPDAAPDIIQPLLARFLDKVPGPQHRAALEICALVRLTTEDLLAHMLAPESDAAADAGDADEAADASDANGATGGADAHALFEWLRGLSFIESASRGVFPHDVAREVLLADLRWRNAERYQRLHRRARPYYSARLKETQGREQQRILFDYIFLHADNAVVRFAFEWCDSSGIATDTLRPSDHEALLAMTRRHEGNASAALLAHWLERQPEGTLVFRSEADAGSSAEPAGFGVLLKLHPMTAEERAADPATRAAWEHLQRRAPLRPGEGATHFRFWMARDTYQDVSPIQSLIIVNNVRQCVTMAGLAYTFFSCADPAFWEPVFSYAEMQRIPEADFTVGGKRYGVFGNDWRTLSPTEWLSLLADKETAGGEPVTPPPPSARLVVLSRPDFETAVHDALRDFTRPDALQRNPLLRSRLVVERRESGAASTEEPATVLRQLICSAAESLQGAPRQARGGRALRATYLEPAPTQEEAADRLDLPFSTYRRHLSEGIAHVTEILWRQEIRGPEK